MPEALTNINNKAADMIYKIFLTILFIKV